MEVSQKIGSLEMWVIILTVGAGSFCLRFFFLGLFGSAKKEVSSFLKNFLLYLPAAAFAALAAPRIFLPGISRVLDDGNNFFFTELGFVNWGAVEFLKPYLQPIFFALVSQEAIAALAATLTYLLLHNITLTIAVGMGVFWYLGNFLG